MQAPAPDPIGALKFALQLEDNGRAFYMKVAAATEDAMGKKIFRQLAREEIDHKRLLETELARLHAAGVREPERPEGPSDLNAATAASGIFPALRDAWQIGEGAGDADALRVAVGSEENATGFYSKMAEESPEAETRAMYEQLAEMEEGHRKLLQWELDYVLGDGYWCDIAQFDME
ncbi:MAG: ferritin family protein [Armatimonadota bacterium]